MKRKIKSLASKFRKYLTTLPELEEFDDDLCCACAIASEALTRYLKLQEYHAKFVEGMYKLDLMYNDSEFELEHDTNHCWVEVEDKYIVDITASQFNEKIPKVYVTSIGNIDYHPIRRGRKALEYTKKYWPNEQKPLGRLIRVHGNLLT